MVTSLIFLATIAVRWVGSTNEPAIRRRFNQELQLLGGIWLHYWWLYWMASCGQSCLVEVRSPKQRGDVGPFKILMLAASARCETRSFRRPICNLWLYDILSLSKTAFGHSGRVQALIQIEWKNWKMHEIHEKQSWNSWRWPHAAFGSCRPSCCSTSTHLCPLRTTCGSCHVGCRYEFYCGLRSQSSTWNVGKIHLGGRRVGVPSPIVNGMKWGFL